MTEDRQRRIAAWAEYRKKQVESKETRGAYLRLAGIEPTRGGKARKCLPFTCRYCGQAGLQWVKEGTKARPVWWPYTKGNERHICVVVPDGRRKQPGVNLECRRCGEPGLQWDFGRLHRPDGVPHDCSRAPTA